MTLLLILLIHLSTATFSKEINNPDGSFYSRDNSEDDPKNQFFRQIRAYENDENLPQLKSFGEIPSPEGFVNDYSYLYENESPPNDKKDGEYAKIGSQNLLVRKKRESKKEQEESKVVQKMNTTVNVRQESEVPFKENPKKNVKGDIIENPRGDVVKSIIVETTTATIEVSNSNKFLIDEAKVYDPAYTNFANGLVIDDFIRFRRETGESSSQKSDREDFFNVDDFKSEKDMDMVRFKRDPNEKKGKMLLAPENKELEGNREPRGTTKEQWIKTPYPVRTTTSEGKNYKDLPENRDEIRGPRVHFVTQRRLESVPLPAYRFYDRENGARSYSGDKESEREPNKNYYKSISHRYYRDPLPYYSRYDPYDYFKQGPRDRRYENFNFGREPFPAYNRQRRIIYYATLPEVVKFTPKTEVRSRYNDRYDESYFPLAPQTEESLQHRKHYPQVKTYEEDEWNKSPYPQKVFADVNVREIKKNPERRIYSETDRRYPYKGQSYHP